MRQGNLDSEVVYSGVRWSITGQVATEVIRFGVSITLARLLAPKDFGLLAMAGVITGFLSIFRYLGTTDIVIQKKDLSSDLLSSLFIVNVSFGLLLSAGLMLSGPFLAGLYNDPRVGPVIQVLGLTFVISSFGQMHQALLTREMKFSRLIPIGLTTVVVNGLVAISLAFAGLEVWAMVIGGLVSSAASTLLLWRASSWRPQHRFSWSEVRKVLNFSLNLTGSGTINYFSRNADNFIIGRWLGATSLGYYSMAYKLHLYPLLSITRVLMRVLFPAFSRLQDDNEQLGKTFLRVCGGIALITFPLMAGLAAVAGPFVLTVLGEKWSPIIPLIVILSPIGMIQSVAIPTGRIFIAKGRSDWHFRWTLVSGIVIVSSFISGLPWGIVGVASAYAIVMVPLTFISFHLAFRLIDLSFSDLATALGPYAMATGIMAGAVLGCRFGLESMGSRPHLVLGICVASGFLVYSMIIMIKRPVALTDLANVLPGGSTLLNRWSGLIGRKMKERV